MEIKEHKGLELLTAILYDVCKESTQLSYGLLSANWGNGSKHNGESYELHLCEECFFYVVGTLKREHLIKNMFNEDFHNSTFKNFGLK